VSTGKKFVYEPSKLCVVGGLNGCGFREGIWVAGFFLVTQKKIAKMTAKVTMRHFGKQMN